MHLVTRTLRVGGHFIYLLVRSALILSFMRVLVVHSVWIAIDGLTHVLKRA